MLHNLILGPLHSSGLLGDSVVKAEIVQQPMSDVQRQLGLRAVPAPGRLPNRQLTVDDEIVDPWARLLGQVEAQAVCSPLMVQEPLVERADLGIVHDAYTHRRLRDRETLADCAHELLQSRYIRRNALEVPGDLDGNHNGKG